ncbi:MAG: hypothetical protein LBU92_06385 [Prevotellaceae bacterium]|jgi:hypothetical protein|nr:hypothetical protein [Prevotellaceae bacterium]
MKKTIFLFLCASTIFSATAVAQNEVEALRYSRLYHAGTARFSAMGGAFTALGGDATTMAFNPAGIGVYRSGEFTLTPNLMYSSQASSYMGNNTSDDRYSFGLSNIAGIGVINLHQNEGLVNINLGISSSRYNTFSGRTAVQGSPVSEGGSYLAYFADLANAYGTPEYPKGEQSLAYETWIIDDDTINGGYIPSYDLRGNDTEDRRNAETWGSIREFDFSLGGNISHIFYFGLTVGIQNISYSKDLTDENRNMLNVDENAPYDGFFYDQTYRQSGTGYNFKAGFIARPFVYSDFLTGLRIGAAIHTPTFINMNDEWEWELESTFFDNDTPEYLYDSEEGETGYDLQTPFKYMLGAAYTFGSQGSKLRGTLSVDYENVDYSKMKMRTNSNSGNMDFRDANQNITTYYKSTNNLRVGGELNYNKFAFRGGYALYENPYMASAGKGKGDTHIASFGVGIQGASSYVDFTYSRLMQKDREYLFYFDDVYNSGEITHDIVQGNFMVTFGWRF